MQTQGLFTGGNRGTTVVDGSLIKPWTCPRFPLVAVSSASAVSLLTARYLGNNPEGTPSAGGTCVYGWRCDGGLQQVMPLVVGANDSTITMAVALCSPVVMENRGDPKWNGKQLEWRRRIIYTCVLTSGTVGSYTTGYNDDDGSNQSINIVDTVGTEVVHAPSADVRWIKDATPADGASICLFDAYGWPFVQVLFTTNGASGTNSTHAGLLRTETNGG